jgi:L-ascorbate metabolism protein UlaG (beta-lactamase superfamily)
MQGAMRVTYLGHSTVLIELDGVRLLTDPLLRDRVIHLVRHSDPVGLEAVRTVDAVLISHLHHDHFHPASLRLLDRGALLIVPRGAGAVATRLGFERVAEVGPGDTVDVGGVTVLATPAEHRRGRLLARGPAAVGFRIAGSRKVYFAGDTDLFADMAEIRGDGLDLALLPVWGWGPRLPSGHLDPSRAAEATAVLRPRVVIPIHWGTFAMRGLGRVRPHYLTDPPRLFEGAVAETGEAVEVRVLQPGEAAEL